MGVVMVKPDIVKKYYREIITKYIYDYCGRYGAIPTDFTHLFDCVDSKFFLFIQDSKVEGVAIAGERDPMTIFIYFIYVDEDMRGLGIAHFLLNAVKEYAKEHNYEYIQAGVHVNNEKVNLYLIS